MAPEGLNRAVETSPYKQTHTERERDGWSQKGPKLTLTSVSTMTKVCVCVYVCVWAWAYTCVHVACVYLHACLCVDTSPYKQTHTERERGMESEGMCGVCAHTCGVCVGVHACGVSGGVGMGVHMCGYGVCGVCICVRICV